MTMNSSHRSINGLNQTESFETHERDYDDGVMRKTSEEIQRTDSPLKSNGNHYQHQNSKINKRRLIDLISLENSPIREKEKVHQYRFVRHNIDVYARI